MDLKELHKEDFSSHMSPRGEPSIRFERSGQIRINKAAVKHLGLMVGENTCVSVIVDKEHPLDFFVRVSHSGWKVREVKAEIGSMTFNCAGLAKMVIEKTWQSRGHAAGCDKPDSCVLGVALLPVDNNCNKDVYALIRKKG